MYINELLKSTNTYNPEGFADGATIDLTGTQYDFGGEPPVFDVEDLEQVVTDLHIRNAPTFEDGNYACLCSWKFLQALRRDDEFREVARYPGNIPSTNLVPGASAMQPPQVPFSQSPFYAGIQGGQAYDLAGQTMMPTGFVFNGVRFFASNNMPKALVELTYSNANNGALNGTATRNGEIGIFFGPEALGIGLGGNGPEILLNNNDDFGRFVIAIWRMFCSWELLDERFVTVARTYVD